MPKCVELHVGGEVVLRVEQHVGVTHRRVALAKVHAKLGKAGTLVRSGPIGEVLMAVLHGEAQPAPIGVQRHAEIGRTQPLAAIAGGILTAGELDIATLRASLQDDVDDAGNRVGAILGRGAVAQDLDVVDRRQRDGIEVHGLRTATDHAVVEQDRAGVPALAVDQHQHLVGRQAAQLCRALRVRGVGRGRAREVQGGDDARKRGGQIGGAGLLQHLGRHHVDGRQ